MTGNTDDGETGGSVTVLINTPPSSVCPWDCQPVPDGNVGINDFLELLGTWTQSGTSCDFGAGPPGIGIEDFLQLLANWGLCP